jgi:hypothetical protein
MSKLCSQCGTPVGEDAKFCQNCGSLVATSVRQSTPPQGEKRTRSRYIVWALLVFILLVGLVSYVKEAFRIYHPVIEKQPVVTEPLKNSDEKVTSTTVESRVEGPFIIVSLRSIREKRIVRFYDPDGIQTVPILAYITPDGRLVTAMSISENCRSTDFYVQGEFIHCASCPSYWNSSSLEAYACCQKYYPDPIASSVLGDEVRIEKDVVRKWQPRS